MYVASITGFFYTKCYKTIKYCLDILRDLRKYRHLIYVKYWLWHYLTMQNRTCFRGNNVFNLYDSKNRIKLDDELLVWNGVSLLCVYPRSDWLHVSSVVVLYVFYLLFPRHTTFMHAFVVPMLRGRSGATANQLSKFVPTCNLGIFGGMGCDCNLGWFLCG